jgi:hypothetical protein
LIFLNGADWNRDIPMANFAADDERVDTDIRQVERGNSMGEHTANSAIISSKPPGRSMICVNERFALNAPNDQKGHRVKLRDQRTNHAPKTCQAPLGATNRNHTLSAQNCLPAAANPDLGVSGRGLAQSDELSTLKTLA